MRAIILAAGLGRRLMGKGGAPKPKCLLRFGGVTLLERHLRLFSWAGIGETVIAVGYEHNQIEAELHALRDLPAPQLVFNPDYQRGSMLTVDAVRGPLTAGGDVLLMDADVLYDQRLLAPLVADTHANRLLMDREFEPGEEPVKLCLRDGLPVELRKKPAADLLFDTQAESVGFFRFTAEVAGRLAQIVDGYVAENGGDLPHEEALRDLLLERPGDFHTADITGAPWLEIDFPGDVGRAQSEIFPQLLPLPGRLERIPA